MKQHLPIIAEARQDIAACLRRTKHEEHRKALVVLHLVAGGQVDSIDEVAGRVGEEPDAVASWLATYQNDGITAFSTAETREALDSAAARGVTKAPDRRPISRSGPVTVMLGEADDLVARIIEAKLDREGINVRRTRDGAELVSVLEETVPHLVLVDVRLAGLDGFQVTRWIRENEQLTATPVILLGWPGKETDVVDAFDAGADDFVLKPFSPIDLFARIQRLVRKQLAPQRAVNA